MNIQYISGFFDADGSISMCKTNKTDKYKSIKLDFTNTELQPLLEIQKFLLSLNIKTHLSTKLPRKENHSLSYALSTNSNQVSISLCKILQSIHPKKRHRINTVIKYHDLVTRRNGKYSPKEHMRKLAYERLFYSTYFHK